MPRESDRTRAWERERRNRLNEAFSVLSKHLPDYVPSIRTNKIDILHKAATYIEELQKKHQEWIDSKLDKADGDVIKKLQDRVKKLLTRNEQLTLFINKAGIKVPSAFGNVKKLKWSKRKWANKVTPQQAEIHQNEHEKENVLGTKPSKSKKASKNSQGTPKHRKVPVRKNTKNAKSKKGSTNVLMLSKSFIVVPQPVTTQPCYVVSNTAASNIIKTTANSLALTTTSFVTTTPVTPNPKHVTSVKTNIIPSLGPGTLVFADGRAVPVLPQMTQIPQLITNPFPINSSNNPTVILLPNSTTKQVKAQTIVTNSAKMKVNNKETKCPTVKPSSISKPQLMSRISPKIYSKVPIPALTSRYANNFVLRNTTSNHNNKTNTERKQADNINKIVTKTTAAEPTENSANKKIPNKRHLESTEISNTAKKAKTENQTPECNATSAENIQPKVDIISSEYVKSANEPKTSLKDASHIEAVNTVIQTDVNTECRVKNIETKNTVTNENSSIVTNSGNDMPSDSGNNVVINEADDHELTKKLVETSEKHNEDEESKEMNSVVDSAKSEINAKELIIEQTCSSKSEKLDETISDIVSDATSNATKDLIVSEQSVDEKHTVDAIKDKQEPQDKQDDVTNEMKTLEMNLPHSELSNDIFASLQVPSGCQNPESTSPTAAFLLAFPLVSSLTGVKVTEVIDEENTESQSGTPTLLQIGTIDNTKPTQSHSESLTPSLLNLDNLSFFSTKDICTGFYNTLDTIPVSSASNSTIVPISCANKNGTASDHHLPELSTSLPKETNSLTVPPKCNIQHMPYNNSDSISPVHKHNIQHTSHNNESLVLGQKHNIQHASCSNDALVQSQKHNIQHTSHSNDSLVQSQKHNIQHASHNNDSLVHSQKHNIQHTSHVNDSLIHSQKHNIQHTSHINDSLVHSQKHNIQHTSHVNDSLVHSQKHNIQHTSHVNDSLAQSQKHNIHHSLHRPHTNDSLVQTHKHNIQHAPHSNDSLVQSQKHDIHHATHSNDSLVQSQKHNIQHASHNNDSLVQSQKLNIQHTSSNNINNSNNNSGINNISTNNSNISHNNDSINIGNRAIFNELEPKKHFHIDMKIDCQDKTQATQHITSNISTVTNIGCNLSTSIASNLSNIEKSTTSDNNVNIPVTAGMNNPYNNLYPQRSNVVTDNTTYKRHDNVNIPESKSLILQTDTLVDSHMNLQNTYQQSKVKVNDTVLKNTEIKPCMNYNQNTQQNKPYSNLHCSNFQTVNNEKIATTCSYNHIPKTFMNSLYTNSNMYTYNTEPSQNYYKRSQNRNYYNANYQSYEDCRKSDNANQYSNNYYYHANNTYSKDKYPNNSVKTQQNNNQLPNQVRPPINWMTTPDNRQTNTDYVMPTFSKENYVSSTMYSGNTFMSNNQTTYFNSNPIYSNSDIINEPRKTLDLPIVSVNSYQRTDVEENHFSWSPTKMPQFLEPPTFVSSTLTNLIGDLALGNPATYLDQKCDKYTREAPRNKENLKRTKTNNSYENQSNFLSVSQLVEHTKNERPTSRRNSGNRSNKSTTQNKSNKRNSKIQENKDTSLTYKNDTGSTPKNSQIKQFGIHGNDIFCTNSINNSNTNANTSANNNNNSSSNHNSNVNSINQNNKNRNVNKNLASSYSAEALISHQPHHVHTDNLQNKQINNQQNYNSNSKTLPVPPFLPENIISYFPPVDIPQENTFNQNQNYQPTTFSHNFTSTFQNNTYNSNFIPPVTTITTNYLPTSNFIHDVTSHDYLADNLNIFTNKDTKQYNKAVSKNPVPLPNREDKTVQNNTSNCPNYKKTKRKQATEAAVPNFDFPFLPVPGAINSPILSDDFHSHSTFLPPPTPSQLYPCKNPLYPKQSTDLTTSSLLPLPPPVPVTRSNIQHPEISPSINTGGTSLTNFNLSTIFPEINKSPINYPDTRLKDQTPTSYTTSGSQVPFNNKSTFSMSYLNCPVTQYNQ